MKPPTFVTRALLVVRPHRAGHRKDPKRFTDPHAISCSFIFRPIFKAFLMA